VFVALLDTCTLWPSLRRDFLLSMAVEGLYRPTWSEVILEELEYCEAKKLVDRGTTAPDAEVQARHLIDQMRTHFAGALVTGWEPLEGTFGLPDPDDEHVVAAAVLASAGAIVTDNLKDFPTTNIPTGVEVLRPAQFAFNTVAVDPGLAADAVREISRRSGRHGPALTPPQILTDLDTRYGMHDATALLRPHLH